MNTLFEIEEKPTKQTALLSDTGIKISYGELKRQIEIFSRIFGLRCLIFCMCKNEPGAVVGYLGALENKMVPLLLDAGLKEEAFSSLYRIYCPQYIWASVEWAAQYSVYVQEKVYEAYGYGLWKTGNPGYPLHSDLGMLLATSGSTGDPKLVRLSRKNVKVNAASICAYLHLDETERPITTLPMQYSYGLSIINSHLLAGAAILMTTAGYVQAGFWDFFEKQQATSFGGVPYTYEILKKIHLFQKKLPSLRTMTQAGGKLSVSLQKEVAEWAESQGIAFFVMYGQTEATARMGYLPSEQCLKKLGSMGIAIPGGKFSLVNENGDEILEAGQTGELVYTGDNVSLGYAVRSSDLELGDERHGVLYTGDMAKCDEEGYYYIVGRKKRFVKVFGVRVSLDGCEQLLREKYPEFEIACAGEDDHLKIYVSAEESAENRNELLVDELSAQLHLNRKGFEVIPVPVIPKNQAGKICYSRLP